MSIVSGQADAELPKDALLDEELELHETHSQAVAKQVDNAGQAQAQELATTPPRRKRGGGDSDASGSGVSASQTPSPAKICLACQLPATKGSLCTLHKRVSDNVYNDEKKKKAADPERWKRFMLIRKQQGPEWVDILVQAEAAKGGNPGSGKNTGTFTAMVSVNVVKQESGIAAGLHVKSMNCRMFMKKIKEEWGWESKEAAEEWRRLLAATAPHKITQRPTLPGRQLEPWIYVHDFDELVTSQGLTHSNEVHMREKEKKNPKDTDISEAEQALAGEALHFSDHLFQNMSATSSALQAVRESGSSVVDASGHSFIFSEKSGFRSKAQSGASPGTEKVQPPKKSKAKTFDLEDQLDGLDFRLTKKAGATKKMCEDLIKDVEDFLSKEPAETLAKMSRMVVQVKVRLVVVKAVCFDVPPDKNIIPQKLEFSSIFQELGLMPDVAAEMETFVEEHHTLQYEAVQQLHACVKAGADAAASAAREGLSDADQAKADGEVKDSMESFVRLIGQLNEADFLVPGSSDVYLPEKDVLQHMLKYRGWAGSGFETAVDFQDLLQDVDAFMECVFLKLYVECAVLYFHANAKPMLEPQHMSRISSMALVVFQHRLLFRVQQSEDGVKNVETAFKDTMELNKMLVSAVRSSFSTLQKQSRELRRESARLQSQQEKERLAAEKQREKEEKNRLRSIADQMKGADKLPGLLAYCGAWVKPVPEFKSIDEFRAGRNRLDATQPFLLADPVNLRDEDSTSASRVNFTLFKARLGSNWCHSHRGCG